MNEIKQGSRMNRFEKRRRVTTLITSLVIIAIVLVIILLGIWFLGGKKNEKGLPPVEPTPIEENENDGNNGSNESDNSNITQENNVEESNENNEVNSESNNSNEEEREIIDIEEIESSDENVRKAYTGNWAASGTEQTGPHTTDYNGGSQDRIEIKRAIVGATGLDGDQMTEHWIGNGGDQKVIATVSDLNNTKIYRVHLSWIDEKGWQPTQVEILNEIIIKKGS